MRVGQIAKRYARALYEEAKKANQHEVVLNQVRALNQVFADKATAGFFSSPMISADEKATVALKACQSKLQPQLVNAIAALAERGRISLFAEFSTALEQIADEEHGVTRGVVRSAAPLATDAQKKMEETVTKATGKKVIFTFQEDPQLLGGMVAQVGGWTFDDSLSSHLRRMNEELNRRSN